MGRQQGLTDGQLRALADFESSDVFTPLEKHILSYAVAMTATPAVIPDALFAALRESFDEAQLVELTSCIAWQNYRARFDHALGVESQGFCEGAFCPVPSGH